MLPVVCWFNNVAGVDAALHRHAPAEATCWSAKWTPLQVGMGQVRHYNPFTPPDVDVTVVLLHTLLHRGTATNLLAWLIFSAPLWSNISTFSGPFVFNFRGTDFLASVNRDFSSEPLWEGVTVPRWWTCRSWWGRRSACAAAPCWRRGRRRRRRGPTRPSGARGCRRDRRRPPRPGAAAAARPWPRPRSRRRRPSPTTTTRRTGQSSSQRQHDDGLPPVTVRRIHGRITISHLLRLLTANTRTTNLLNTFSAKRSNMVRVRRGCKGRERSDPSLYDWGKVPELYGTL